MDKYPEYFAGRDVVLSHAISASRFADKGDAIIQTAMIMDFFCDVLGIKKKGLQHNDRVVLLHLWAGLNSSIKLIGCQTWTEDKWKNDLKGYPVFEDVEYATHFVDIVKSITYMCNRDASKEPTAEEEAHIHKTVFVLSCYWDNNINKRLEMEYMLMMLLSAFTKGSSESGQFVEKKKEGEYSSMNY